MQVSVGELNSYIRCKKMGATAPIFIIGKITSVQVLKQVLFCIFQHI